MNTYHGQNAPTDFLFYDKFKENLSKLHKFESGKQLENG